VYFFVLLLLPIGARMEEHRQQHPGVAGASGVRLLFLRCSRVPSLAVFEALLSSCVPCPVFSLAVLQVRAQCIDSVTEFVFADYLSILRTRGSIEILVPVAHESCCYVFPATVLSEAMLLTSICLPERAQFMSILWIVLWLRVFR
jgi:hypothetical protein